MPLYYWLGSDAGEPPTLTDDEAAAMFVPGFEVELAVALSRRPDGCVVLADGTTKMRVASPGEKPTWFAEFGRHSIPMVVV